MTAGVAAVAAGCSEKPGEVADDGSVTVEHIFGETKVPAPPKRVVSAGFTEQDDLLAVGVVPIAVTNWWGDQPFGVWPWALPKLGPAQPEVLSLADGIQVDRIAALKPDLIVATNAGVDQDIYNKLSEIAPTIPQSGQDAFFEPWKNQAATIGQAVFKFDEMAALVKGVDDKFTAVGTNNRSSPARRCSCCKARSSTTARWRRWPAGVSTFSPRWDYRSRTTSMASPRSRAFIPRDQMVSVLDAADVLVWAPSPTRTRAA